MATAQKVTSIAKPTAKFETITPKKAGQLLAKNGRNRAISKRRVEDYALAMSNGEWKLTGQALQFDMTGRLVDGQHRLQAILLSGTTHTMLVVENLPGDVFDVIDTGKPRNAADVLTVDGHMPGKKAAMLAAATRMAITWQQTGRVTGENRLIRSAPNKVVREWVEANEDMRLLADVAEEWYGGKGVKPISDGMLLFHMWAQYQVDANFAERYMRRVYTMIGCVSDDPEYLLHEKLVQAKAGHVEISNPHKHAIIIQTWNFIRGEMAGNYLFWHRSADFPVYL